MSFKLLFAVIAVAFVAVCQVVAEPVGERNNGGSSSGTGATVIVSGSEHLNPTMIIVFLVGALTAHFVVQRK
jgi:hypothetical protein